MPSPFLDIKFPLLGTLHRGLGMFGLQGYLQEPSVLADVFTPRPCVPGCRGPGLSELLIGMPGKSWPWAVGQPADPAEVASLQPSWSSGQGIRLDIWRLGAWSSLLLLCWVTLSRLLGLSVPHLPPAFSLSGKTS